MEFEFIIGIHSIYALCIPIIVWRIDMSYYLKDLIDLRKKFVKAYDSKKYADALDFGTRIVDLYKDNNACKTEDYAEDLYNLAIICDDMHITEKAKEYYKESAKLKKDILGENSQSYFDSLTNLGILHSVLGEFDEAEEVLKTVSGCIKNNAGVNTAEYVESLYNLGNMYVDAEKYDMGISILSEALECAKRIKNYDPQEYIDIHVSIADACAKSGNYRRACDEYGRAKKISERENEKNSYFRMNYLISYSNIYQKLEKYENAAEIYSEAVKIREEIMSIHHLDFISMLNNLAAIYSKNDEYEKAMDIHNRVLELVEEMLGKNHVFYADVLTNIGIDYSGLDDTDKAIEYHNKALDIKRSIVGEKHQHYIFTLMSLADVYEDMGKYDRAIDIQNTAMELRRQCFGEINESICDSLMNLGRLYMEKEDLVKAQGFFMRSLIMGKEIMIAGFLDVRCYTETVRLMSEACCRRSDAEKTEQFCEKYIALRRSKYGIKHPKYARALYDSAMLFDQLGNCVKSSEYLEAAFDIAESMCGTDTPFCMECLYRSGEMLYKIKDYTEAYDRLKKAAAVYKKNDGDEEELVRIMYLQAKAQYMLGFHKKAEECAFRADGIASRAGSSMEFIIDEKIDYAEVMTSCGDYERAAEKLNEIYKKIGNCQDSVLIFEMLSAATEAYYNCANYGEAADKASEAIKYAKKNIDLVDIKLLAAKAHLKLGDFQKAAEMLEDIKSVVYIDDNISDKYKPIVMCMLGEVYSNMGEMEKADVSFYEGLKETKNREDISEDKYCEFLDMAVDIAEKLNEYSKAIEYVSERALLIRKNEGESENFCECIIHTAKLYCLLERYSDAVVMYEKAADMYRSLYGEDSEKYVGIIVEMCRVYESENKNRDIIEKLEKIKDFKYKKNEVKNMLIAAYKNTGAFAKLLKLKFGEKQ